MSETLFVRRKLRVRFVLVDNGFNDGDVSLTYTGLRVSCQISNAGFESGVMCSLRIEGMPLSDMNRLSVLQTGIIQQSMNTVTVSASDGGPWQDVFSGGVLEAFADFNGSPETAFNVMAQTMAIPSAVVIPSTSFADSVSVAVVAKSIADKAGLSFQNNGVTTVLAGGVTYNGSAAEQLHALASATRMTYNISMDILSIWPEQISVGSGEGAIEISAETGMFGYPAYSQYGVSIRTLFNNLIGLRTPIKLSSEYAPASWVNQYGQMNGMSKQALHLPSNGVWAVIGVKHDLQSETPDGQWTTYIEAARPDSANQVAYVR